MEAMSTTFLSICGTGEHGTPAELGALADFGM
jgi:hypothetical protein